MWGKKGRGPHTGIAMVVTGVMVYVCAWLGGGDKRGQSHKVKVRSQGGSGQCINCHMGIRKNKC